MVPSAQIRNFFLNSNEFMTGTAICGELWGFIPWMELKSWASWHLAQEHVFWDCERSTAGSIASTEENAKTWEIPSHTSALHREHIGWPVWETTSNTYSINVKTGGRGEGAPVLPADLRSPSAAHPWAQHVPQGHPQAPMGRAACSTLGCPTPPCLAPVRGL